MRLFRAVWGSLYYNCLMLLMGFGGSLSLQAQLANSNDQLLQQQADAAAQEGDLLGAIAFLKQLAKSAQAQQQYEQLATAQLDQGLYFLQLQQLDSAQYHCAQSLKTIDRALDTNTDLATSANYVQSIVLYYKGAITEAIYHAKTALKLKQLRAATPDDLAVSLEQLANMHQEKAAYQKALEYYQQAIYQYRQLDEEGATFLGLTYLNMGICYNRLQAPQKALQYYQSTKQLFQTIETAPRQWLSLYNSFSISYRDLQQLDSAQYYIDLALQLLPKVPEQQMSIYGTLGFLQLEQGNPKAAIQTLETVLKAYENSQHPSLPKIYLKLGESQAALHHFPAALAAYQKGLSSLVADFQANTINNPQLAQIKEQPLLVLRLLHAKAKLLSQQPRQTSLALATYQLAAEVLFLLQRQSPTQATQLFLANKMAHLHEEGFNLAYQAYLKTPNTQQLQQAFFFVERSKAKLLLDQLWQQQQQEGIHDSLQQQLQTLYLDRAFYQKKWRAAHQTGNKAQQGFFQAKIFELDDRLEMLQAKANQTTKIWSTNVYQPPSLAQVQQQLLKQANSMLIAYFIAKDQLYGFFIEKDTTKLIELGTTKQLAGQVQDFWAGLLNPQSQKYTVDNAFLFYTTAAHQLYQALLKDHLPNSIQHLYIIQDEQLSFLPFAALLKTAAPKGKVDYLQLDYLVQHYTFSYNYSAALFLHQIALPKQQHLQQFWGIAPFSQAAPSSQFSSLPFSKEEIETAAQLIHGQSSTNEAINSRYFCQQAQANIIHIASHATVDFASPSDAFLAFAEQSALYAYEIPYQPIEANLVVLSACETGLGKFVKGEGSLSLARAFFQAGVPSVLMTLWKIRDQSSAQLMQNFYQNLAQNASLPKALQQAQQDFLAKKATPTTAQPYFWAAYTSLGAPQSPITPSRNNWLWGSALGCALLGLGYFRWSRSKQAKEGA